MAFVMKEPSPTARGILVLTHKELGLVDTGLAPVQRGLDLLAQRFVIGLHYGHFHDNLVPAPWASFHFAPPDTVRFAPGTSARAFPLNSSHFIPEFFRDRGLPKQWDIISVTRPIPLKGNDRLLRVLGEVKRRRPETRALIVSAGTKGGRNEETARLWAQYQRELSFDARQDIVLLPFELEGRPFAFPRKDLAFLCNSSRVFTLFSDKEGGSKAIKEALLCGLPVVLRRDLIGGGLEFATERNSRLFASDEEAVEAFIEVLSHPDSYRFDTHALAEKCSETHTLGRLESLLSQLFAELGEPWDGVWDKADLSMKLPSHHPGLIPEHLKGGWTSDLASTTALLELFGLLLERTGGPRFELSPAERRYVRAKALRRRATKQARVFAFGLKRRLRSLRSVV